MQRLREFDSIKVLIQMEEIKMKKTKKIAFTLSAALFTSQLLPGVSVVNNPVGVQAAAPSVNSANQLDENRQQLYALLNSWRQQIGLSILQLSPELIKAAQSHAEYLSYHQTNGHSESSGKELFTGIGPQERAEYFGYSTEKKVTEVLSFQSHQSKFGLDDLIDAPYHRNALLNPFLKEAGIGFKEDNNGLNPNAISLGGASKGVKETVVYPYNNQNGVKTAWYNNESPDPLAGENVPDKYVGYPITLSMFGETVPLLTADQVKLTDSKGNKVEHYLIDNKKPGNLNMIIIVPKDPLLFNEKYTVDIDVSYNFGNGQKGTEKKTWTFQTVKEPIVDAMGVRGKDDQKVLRPIFNSGLIKEMKYRVKDENGQTIQTYNLNNDHAYKGKGLADGTYTAEIIMDAKYTWEIPFVLKNNIVSMNGTQPKPDNEAEKPKDPTDPIQPPVQEKPSETTPEIPSEEKPSDTDYSKFQLVKELEIEEFNEASIPFTVSIDPETIKDSSLFMINQDNKKIDLEWELTEQGKKLVFRPKNKTDIVVGNVYSIYIDHDIVRGTNGQKLPHSLKYIFHLKNKVDSSTPGKPNNGDQPQETPSADLSKFKEKFDKFKDVAPTKSFYVSIKGGKLNASTVNKNTVFVLNKEGKMVEVIVSLDSQTNKIKISPKGEWVKGETYTAYLDNSMKGINGKSLKTPIKFEFEIAN